MCDILLTNIHDTEAHCSQLLNLISNICEAENVNHISETHKQCTLRTKYYRAQVDVKSFKYGDINNSEYEPVQPEALILYCEKIDGNWRLENASATVERTQPTITLLVCETVVREDSESAVAWCLANNAELVPLQPAEDEIAEAEECHERWGVARVVQALESHQWPNAVLLEEGEERRLPTSANASNGTTTNRREDEGENAEREETFEELFERFAAMRAHADTLEGDARRAFAEKVALDFMRACGEDPSDLSEEDVD